MTPTKDDALLERIQITLEYFTDEFKDYADVWNSPVSSYSGGITPNDLIAIKQALTQPPVDVEAPKAEISKGATPSYAHVVSHTIDYLVSKGYLK